MLTMRANWDRYNCCMIPTELFKQIPPGPLREDCAVHLIGASLELLIAGLCKNPPVPVLHETPSNFSWQLNDTTYVFFPAVDDITLDKAVEYSFVTSQVIIIVPPDNAKILWNACCHMLPTVEKDISLNQPMKGKRIHKNTSCHRTLATQLLKYYQPPLIIPLNTHLSLRIAFTATDLCWPTSRVVIDLLHRYNRRALNAKCDETILVAIPTDKSYSP